MKGNGTEGKADLAEGRKQVEIKIRIVVVSFTVVALLVVLKVPILGYLTRIADAVGKIGYPAEAGADIVRHTAWFTRFFTGPPSDAEMIDFLNKHRADFDRIAETCMQTPGCPGSYQDRNVPELMSFKKNTGMSIYPSGESYVNSIFRREYEGMNGIAIQGIDEEPHRWIGSDYEWLKDYIYVPPLVKSTKSYEPDDPKRVLRHNNVISNNLDVVRSELENDINESAVRQIDKNWFLRLTVYKNG